LVHALAVEAEKIASNINSDAKIDDFFILIVLAGLKTVNICFV